RSLPLVCLFLLFAAPAFAGPMHVRWTARLEPADARAGESAQIVLTADIDANWHFYSLTTPDGGPKRMKIELAAGSKLTIDGTPVQPAPLRKHDETFGVDVESYEKAAAFGIPVKLASDAAGPQTAIVKANYQDGDPSLC